MPPSRTFALAPFGVAYTVPKLQAHRSELSSPWASYHPLRSGSVAVSASSWASTDAIASAPGLLLGLRVCTTQAEKHRAPSPMNAYLISVPRMVVFECQPQ